MMKDIYIAPILPFHHTGLLHGSANDSSFMLLQISDVYFYVLVMTSDYAIGSLFVQEDYPVAWLRFEH